MHTIFNFLGCIVISIAYENIALHKPTYQQHPFYNLGDKADVSNAVDGLKSDLDFPGGQCVISGNFRYTATMWVDLTRILSIHHISIYYRTGNVGWDSSNAYAPRFLGFSVYVSNTTNRLDGVLCFKDNNFTLSTIPAVFNTTCPVHGQYVIYYNERKFPGPYPPYSQYAYNEICELEVYGCSKTGFYGSNCSIPCPDPHCRYCHTETGTCQGCHQGYRGHHCELDCLDGYFGRYCANKCNPRCAGCNTVNGSCDKGCLPGWKGDYCAETCNIGRYGQGCNNICGKCINQDICNHINGTCLSGCETGYQGVLCKLICDPGTYGLKCNHICGHCLHKESCIHTNGTCLKGCDPGYVGHLCRASCDMGRYGINCIEGCGRCRNLEVCFHVNGSCPSGCEPGYSGHACKTTCQNGTYGHDCMETCGFCLNNDDCYPVNGTCIKGCLPGYTGDKCKTPCGNGTYGLDCSELCGHCLDQKNCHNVNGSCLTGCRNGFRGQLCNLPCKSGTYGEKCNNICGYCRDGEICHHKNGSCLNGCNPGYLGNLCKTECSPGNFGENCSSRCGNCPDGNSCHHRNGSCLQSLFCYENKCNCDSKTGLYVATTILSILLAVAVGVIFLQNHPKTKIKMSWGRPCSKTCPDNVPQNYSNFTAFEEMHQYSTMDYAKQDSPYQNTPEVKQSQN